MYASRPALALALLLANACAMPETAPLPDAQPVVDAALSADSATPASDAADTPDDGAAVPDAIAPACAALPDLSDPRNAVGRGTVFELAGLRAERNAGRHACVASSYDGAEFAVRFTSPIAARWQLSVGGIGGRNYRSLAVLDGCTPSFDAPAMRCAVWSESTSVRLAAGQTVTVVVDGLMPSSEREMTLRAEQISVGSAPELTGARVFRSARGAFVAVDARDAEMDANVVHVELLDARGSVVAFGAPSRVEWPYWGAREPLLLGYIPENVTRARVWVRDDALNESAHLEVEIGAHAGLPAGERCEGDSYSSAFDPCGDDAICVYERSTGQLCRARVNARYDAEAGALRVDLDAQRIPAGVATVLFLDDRGAVIFGSNRISLEGFDRAAMIPGDSHRHELLAYDHWRPEGGRPARVRVLLTGGELGEHAVVLEAPLQGPVVQTARGARCDASSTARYQCGGGLVCVGTAGSWETNSCGLRDPGCTSAWGGRTWAPGEGEASSAIEGRAERDQWQVPECLRPYIYTGETAREDTVDFVAPKRGTYRFTLTSREEGASYVASAISVLRSECSRRSAVPTLACGAEVAVSAEAGEHLTLLVSARGSTMDYRLAVAVPSP